MNPIGFKERKNGEEDYWMLAQLEKRAPRLTGQSLL